MKRVLKDVILFAAAVALFFEAGPVLGLVLPRGAPRQVEVFAFSVCWVASLSVVICLLRDWIRAEDAARARRRDEIRRGDRCARCGHDLRTTRHRCPQCGSIPPTASPPSPA